MAQDLQTILGKTINSTKELRAEINALKDSLVQAEKGSEEWKSTADKLIAAQERLSDVTSAGKASVDAAEDSIVGLEKQYKALYNTYKLLSEEQRNSDFGKNMAQSLEGLSNKLNTTKKDVGNFKDNIGRYADDAMAAFNEMGISVGNLQGPLKLASGGLKGLTGTFKTFAATLLANPITWIIVAFKALVEIVGKVKEAIQGNEETQMRLNVAMSAFQPIIDAVSNAFDRLAKRVVDVVEWIAKAYNQLRLAKAAFTDFIGLTDGAQEQIQAEIDLYNEIAETQNRITQEKRDQAILNEEEQAMVEELKNQAAGISDVAERTKLLTRAKELQEGITKRSIQLAEEELEVMRKQASLTANSAEDNQKLADKEKEVNQIRRDGATKVKELTSQILGLTNTTNAYADAIKKEKEEAKKYYEESIENEKTLTQKTREEQERRIALMKKYGYDTKAYERQIQEQKYADYANTSADVLTQYDNIVNAGTGRQFDTAIHLKETTLILIQDYFNILKNLEKTAGWEEVEQAWEDAGASLNEALVHSGMEAIPELKSEEHFLFYIEILKREIQDLKKEAKNLDLENIFKVFDKDIATGEYNTASLINAVNQDTTLTEEERIQKIEEINRGWLQKKIELLDTELMLEGISAEKRMELEIQIFDLKEELRQQDYDKEKEAQEALAELQYKNFEENRNLLGGFANVADSIGSISAAVAELTKVEMEEGKLSEKEYKKKQKNLLTLEKIQLAVAIAAIAADTASGIMGIWKGYALEKVANAETAMAAGPAAAGVLAALNTKSLISAILNTTGIAVAGSAQIAAAAGGYVSNVKAINDMGGGSSEVTAVAPAQIDSSAYSYTRQLQTEEEEENLNKPIYVTVTDIEEGLNRVQVRDEEASW